MGGQFGDGLRVMASSVRVFREQPSLAVFPLSSVVAVGVACGAFGLALLEFGPGAAVVEQGILLYGCIFVVLAIATSVGIFFNAALAHCVAQHFRGEAWSVRGGLRRAWEVRGAIAKWALVSATIGTGLSILEDKVPGAGLVVSSVLDITWAVMTFFIVPVIVLGEADSLRSGLRESARTFRDTWGESLSAGLTVGLSLLPPVLVGVALLFYAYVFASGSSALATGALGAAVLIVTIVVGQVVSTVLRVALYGYATAGAAVGPVAELGPQRLLE